MKRWAAAKAASAARVRGDRYAAGVERTTVSGSVARIAALAKGYPGCGQVRCGASFTSGAHAGRPKAEGSVWSFYQLELMVRTDMRLGLKLVRRELFRRSTTLRAVE